MTTPEPLGHILEHIKSDLARAGLGSESLLCAEELIDLPSIQGAYALIVKLVHKVPVDRPRNGPDVLRPGWYVYAGSARGPGGIHARLARHFRIGKRIHWHIDQLTTADDARIWAHPVPGGHECELLAKLSRSDQFQIACPGFGSSDCRKCEGHLLVWRPEQPKAWPSAAGSGF